MADQSRIALPASMRYALQSVDAVPSTLTQRIFQANNGATFGPAGANEIRIPIQADGFLDTNKALLQFTFTNASTSTYTLQKDGACVIQQLRIESQGIEIERIDRYNVWNCLQPQYNASIGDWKKDAVMSGGGQYAVDYTLAGDAVLTTETRVLYVPLKHSGFFNNHHGRAIPQGVAQFELIIRLEPTATAIQSNAAGNAADYTITNARVLCPAYAINDGNIMGEYNRLKSQGFSWSGNSLKTYIGATTAVAQTQIFQINDRSASLKALVATSRLTASLLIGNFNLCCFNTAMGVSRYLFRIQGNEYPLGGVTIANYAQATDTGLNIGHMADEALKAFASSGYSYGDCMNQRDKFITNGGTNNGAALGSSVLAVSLKRFDDSRLAMVGLDTAKNSVPNTLEVTYDANASVRDLTTFAIVEAEWFMSGDGRLSVAI